MIAITNSDIFDSELCSASGKINYLKGVVGEKQTATFNIAVSKFSRAGVKKDTFIFAPKPADYKGKEMISSYDNIITANGKFDFSEFTVGDMVTITGTAHNDTPAFNIADTTTYLVVDKVINKSTLRFKWGDDSPVTFTYETSTDGLNTVAGSDSAILICRNPINALNYKFGLLWAQDENIFEAENYLSKIDGSEQSFSLPRDTIVDATDTSTVIDFDFDGVNKNWQFGGLTIKGNGIDSSIPYTQNFIITHTFIIPPFENIWNFSDIKNGLINNIKDYAGTKCLRYISKFDSGYNPQDPNNKEYTVFGLDILGNTGWFNENFNGKSSGYVLNHCKFYKNGLTEISQVELTTNNNTFEIVINHPTSQADVNLCLGFIQMPDSTDTIDITKNFQQTYFNDRVVGSCNSFPTYGELHGTDEQIFSNVVCERTSPIHEPITIKLTGIINFTANAITQIKKQTGQNYYIYVALQSERENNDSPYNGRASLLINADTLFIDYKIPNLVTNSTKFIPHNDVNETGTIFNQVLPGDEIIVSSIFNLNSQFCTETLNGITRTYIPALKKLAFDIVGSDFNYTDEFILEHFEYSFENDSQSQQGVLDVNYGSQRSFVLPNGDDRKKITIKRRKDLDTSGYFAYELKYALLFRWEYWVKNANVNKAFWDTSLPNNGQNNFWYNYAAHGFHISAKTTVTVTVENIHDVDYLFYQNFIPRTYNSNLSWAERSVKSYLTDGTTELINDNKKYVQGFDNTLIRAYFKKKAGLTYKDENIAVVLWIETFEAGGIYGRTRISSLYVSGAESWFISTDGSMKAKLTFDHVNWAVTAEAYLDYTKLPAVEKFTIYARIYDNSSEAIIPVVIQDGGTGTVGDHTGPIVTADEVQQQPVTVVTQTNVPIVAVVIPLFPGY